MQRNKSTQTCRIGLMVWAASSPGQRIIEGIVDHSRRHCDWEFHIERVVDDAAFTRLMLTHQHFGLAGLIGQFWDGRMYRSCCRLRIPVVDLSGAWEKSRLPAVHVDDVAVGRAVARHFIERGQRHFAYSGLRGGWQAKCRYKGFAAELASAGFRCVSLNYSAPVGKADVLGARERLIHWLREQPKPLALMAQYDVRGEEAVFACKQAKLRVPEDVAIVSADNDLLSAEISPVPLSSVDTAPKRVGLEAASLLQRLLQGSRSKPPCVLVPPLEVVARQSSDLTCVDDPELAAALSYIREHLAHGVKVSDILQAVAVSRRTLESGFRRVTGMSPGAYIVQARLVWAKRLLLDTTLKVARIAERTGFCNPSLFCHSFKRAVGQTPAQFRQLNQ